MRTQLHYFLGLMAWLAAIVLFRSAETSDRPDEPLTATLALVIVGATIIIVGAIQHRGVSR